MALTGKEYSEIYSINTDQQTALEATHAEGHLAHLAINPEDNPFIAGVLKEIKDLQKEIDYLRTEISSNKDKTGITTAQANAITANTAKVTFPGLGTTKDTALAGNTALLQLGTTKDTALKGNTYIPPIQVHIAVGLLLSIQIRMVPPQKGQKKGTAQLGWILEDTINRVLYQGTPQTLV